MGALVCNPPTGSIPPSMHPCLELYEVIRAIFGFIRPQDGSALRALSSAMQACKTFYEPAADTLWHTLDDLTPLVRCLPSHLWYVKSLEGESGIECTVVSSSISLSSVARIKRVVL